MSGINDMDTYRDYFGFPHDKGTPSTGIVYAIYNVGNIVGSFAAGPATDFRGRRWGMFIGSSIIVIGTVIQAPSVNLAQYMVGRFILGFGVAITSSAAPAYVSEMAHPAYRGIMTGVYNTFWFIGGIPGASVPAATNKILSNMSWRIPIWCQAIYSGLVVLFVLFLPESPRWLIANDRNEEALEVMGKYHGEGDKNSAIVQLEYNEMLADIKITGSDKRWWDYRELFNTRETRYRSMLVIAMAFFGQWSGNGPVSYYYPAMLQSAGVTNKQTQLNYNSGQQVVSFGGAVFGAIFTDKWGRRPQLLVSTGIVIAFFVAILALNATNLFPDPDQVKNKGQFIARSPEQAKAIIAMIFLFGFVFSAGWTPLQGLYPVECLRYESRAKGMGMYNLFVNIAGFYNTFVTEIAFTGAGWKYYFLFIFWDAFEFAFIYFFFVETKNRTLEELTAIFTAKGPVKRSLERTAVVEHAGEGVTAVYTEKDKETAV